MNGARHKRTQTTFTLRGSLSYSKETQETQYYHTPPTVATSPYNYVQAYVYVAPPQGPYVGYSYHQPPTLQYQPAPLITYLQPCPPAYVAYTLCPSTHLGLVPSQGPYSGHPCYPPVIPHHSTPSITPSQPSLHPPTIYNQESQYQFGGSSRGSNRVPPRSAISSPGTTTKNIQTWANNAAKSNITPPNEPQDQFGGINRGSSRVPSRSAVSNPDVTTNDVQHWVNDPVQNDISSPSSRRTHSPYASSAPDLIDLREDENKAQNEENPRRGSPHPLRSNPTPRGPPSTVTMVFTDGRLLYVSPSL